MWVWGGGCKLRNNERKGQGRQEERRNRKEELRDGRGSSGLLPNPADCIMILWSLHPLWFAVQSALLPWSKAETDPPNAGRDCFRARPMRDVQVRVQCRFTSAETLRTIRDGEPRMATPTFIQLRSSETHPSVQCCFTATETIRTIRDGEPRTATPTFIQLLLSSETEKRLVPRHWYASLSANLR